MKAYKGFNKDMTCRDFQYKEGGEYETDKAKVFESGFHACENPLDCFTYYNLAEGSIFHEVELSGNIQRGKDDTKCAATKISIGERVTLAGMIKAGIDFVFAKVKRSETPAAASGFGSTAAASGFGSTAAASGFGSTAATSGDRSTAATSGDRSKAATSGYHSTAATSGDCSTAATSGDRSTAAASGYRSTAAASGDCSTAATSGDCSTAAASGNRSTAAVSGFGSTAAASGFGSTSAASGYRSTAAASGYRSTAAASGDRSTAEVRGEESIAVATGVDSKARGCVGSWLVLAERDKNWHILGVKAIRIDGKKYKTDTWYMMKNGKIVEVKR